MPTHPPRSRPSPIGPQNVRARPPSFETGSLTPSQQPLSPGWSVPRKRKTFLPTFATDSPQGWSSHASGSESAKARTASARVGSGMTPVCCASSTPERTAAVPMRRPRSSDVSLATRQRRWWSSHVSSAAPGETDGRAMSRNRNATRLVRRRLHIAGRRDTRHSAEEALLLGQVDAGLARAAGNRRNLGHHRVDRVDALRHHVEDLALDLERAVDDEQRMLVEERAMGRVDLRPDGDVYNPRLVLERDKDEVLGGHRVLDGDGEPRQADDGPITPPGRLGNGDD